MITPFIMVQPFELISVFVLTLSVKSSLLPPGEGVGVTGLGEPVSLLPHAPRHELITIEPALRPNAARKSLRSIIVFCFSFLIV
jgi:hypothetical protein